MKTGGIFEYIQIFIQFSIRLFIRTFVSVKFLYEYIQTFVHVIFFDTNVFIYLFVAKFSPMSHSVTDSSVRFCKMVWIITFVKFSLSHFESRRQTTWLRTNEVFANLVK